MLTLQKYLGEVQRNLGRSAARAWPGHFMPQRANLQCRLKTGLWPVDRRKRLSHLSSTLLHEAQAETSGQQKIVSLPSEDRVADETIAGAHVPGQPFFQNSHAGQIEIHPVLARVGEVGKEAGRLCDAGGTGELVKEVVPEIRFPRIAFQIGEVLALVVAPADEAEVRLFLLDCVHAESPARHETQIQLLKTVVLVIVERADEESRRDVPIVGPTAAHGTGDGAGHVVQTRGCVDLVERYRDQ